MNFRFSLTEKAFFKELKKRKALELLGKLGEILVNTPDIFHGWAQLWKSERGNSVPSNREEYLCSKACASLFQGDWSSIMNSWGNVLWGHAVIFLYHCIFRDREKLAEVKQEGGHKIKYQPKPSLSSKQKPTTPLTYNKEVSETIGTHLLESSRKLHSLFKLFIKSFRYR